MCGNASRTSIFHRMEKIQIQEDETLDDLQLRGLRILQKKKAFRFGLDAVLLADFASIHPTDHVVDLGTGTGILPLLLLGRDKGASFEAFEPQTDLAEMAQRSMRLNGLEDQIRVHALGAEAVLRVLDERSTDAVVCNPPYGMPGHTTQSQLHSQAFSRQQQPDTLNALLNAAFLLLKGKGKLFLIYPAAQMLELMEALRCHQLEPKRFRLVYPAEDKPARLVLIEAVRGARPLLHPMPPLILYNADGSLTNELKSIYHISEQTVV